MRTQPKMGNGGNGCDDVPAGRMSEVPFRIAAIRMRGKGTQRGTTCHAHSDTWFKDGEGLKGRATIRLRGGCAVYQMAANRKRGNLT